MPLLLNPPQSPFDKGGRKNWIPAFAGMTLEANLVSTLGRAVSLLANDDFGNAFLGVIIVFVIYLIGIKAKGKISKLSIGLGQPELGDPKPIVGAASLFMIELRKRQIE
jgi:hypothetical protein